MISELEARDEIVNVRVFDNCALTCSGFEMIISHLNCDINWRHTEYKPTACLETTPDS